MCEAMVTHAIPMDLHVSATEPLPADDMAMGKETEQVGESVNAKW